jgi:hypothetical protein
MHRLPGLRKLGIKVSRAVGLHSMPTPAWPLQHECDTPEMLDQLQSPLFGRLSAELRVSIYEAVLGDPERFLHICLNKKNKKMRRVAHWQCTEMDSPFPTWQHYCFGGEPSLDEEGRPTGRLKFRPITITDDQLLAILLSCRIMYVFVNVSHVYY